jgi:hypothetical protein
MGHEAVSLILVARLNTRVALSVLPNIFLRHDT